MIEFLRIRNLALIADMELEFSPGLNVLTGETGAGKSFIMKALDFITGEKLAANMVRSGCDRAQVEAIFSINDEDFVLRRELIAETGRSRFFINDNLTSQDAVKELRPKLLLHVGQHGQQKLAQPAVQSQLIDSRLGNKDLLVLKEIRLRSAIEAMDRKKSLLNRIAVLSEKRELLELHLADIRKVDPRPGEEEELEEARSALQCAKIQRERYQRIFQILHGDDACGLMELLGRCRRELDVLADDEAEMRPYLDAIEVAATAIDALDDNITRRMRSILQVRIDPESIESRLYAFSNLKRKLKKTMPEILGMREELEQNLSFLDECGLDITKAEKDARHALDELKEVLGRLDAARRMAATGFCSELEENLKSLGFPEQIRVIPDFEPLPLFEDANEYRPRLLWAPNPGQAPQPLERIASGGELSRFLLAVVSLQAEHETMTLIFDEVDAGVGGVTLNKVGDRLEALAEERQIILITHWPNLAARARTHFSVTKTVEDGSTFTRCSRLSETERQIELKRMSGIES